MPPSPSNPLKRPLFTGLSRLSRLSRGARWALAFVLLAAVAARIHGLGSESFWLDEVLSAVIVEGPLGQILDRIPKDKPPLDYYLQALAHPLAVPEISHRIPAAVASLFTISGVAFWGAAWFGRRVGLLAGIVAAFHFGVLYFAQEARPYSLLMAATAWQQGLFALWWRRRMIRPAAWNVDWALLAGLVVLSLACLFTMYSALIVFAGQGIFLLIAPWFHGRKRATNTTLASSSPSSPLPPASPSSPSLSRSPSSPSSPPPRPGSTPRPLIPMVLTYAVAMILVIVPAWFLLWNRAELRPPNDYFYRFEGFHALQIAQMFAHQFLPAPELAALVAAAVLCAALLALGLRQAARIERAGSLHLLLSSVIPFMALPLLYTAIDRQYYSRYAAFTLPGCCILFALGFQRIGRSIALRSGENAPARPRRSRAIAVGLVCAYALVSLVLYEAGRPYRVDWRGAATRIARESQPGECVVVQDGFQKVCAVYYLARFRSPAFVVFNPTEYNAHPPWPGRIWRIFQRFGDEVAMTEFNGLDVEVSGETPRDEKLGEFIAQLGNPPTLRMGDGPKELIGDGWSLPEKWSPDMTIRWALSPRATVFLPLAAPRSGRLAVTVYPHSYENAPPQAVGVVVNGRSLDAHEVPHGAETVVGWNVPAEYIRPGLNEVVFTFRHVRSPSEFQKNYADFRTLAAAVRFVRWNDSDDTPGK